VQCWWWWLNGNVTKDAITRDLEEMKAKGMGGANIIDAAHASQGENTKPPHGPDFGSPEWRELFVHALREADRLDLELGFNIQSGWNLGGPTVTPEHAAKKIVWHEQEVEGGQRIQEQLPEPRNRNYYRDVKLLAIPLPTNTDTTLARVDEFRKKAYHEYPGGFTAFDASGLLNAGQDEPSQQAIDASEVHDISDQLTADGMLDWQAPEGRWLLLRFGYALSGAHVSTSSDNWKGLAIDYLAREPFDQYCQDVLTPILDSAGEYVGRSLKFLHTDSWELGPVNWTPTLPGEFRSRRGYDITPYMPTIAGYVVQDKSTSNRFLNDFRRTLADLIADGKYRAFADYAHARELGIHPESGGPHAAPVDALLCLGRNDVPMGEFWARSQTHRVADTSRLFVKQPSSAAHIYGKRLVMAEAFTTIGPHWEKDPSELKPVFDRVACEGLNLVMWHTFDCSPTEAGMPGNAYFAGTHLNPQVTWWNQADGFLGYLNRCQFLLQQGLPVSDVLYFYGENVPSFVRLKREDPAGVLPGYDYDVTNAEVLRERTRVEQGRIVLPDGTSYAALVLPPGGTYGLDSLKQIARLADAGALVIGEKPALPIGLFANEAEEGAFQQLVDRLWGEQMVDNKTARDALHQRGISPDFSFTGIGTAQLDYIHRRTADAEIYFVVNSSDDAVAVECSFRVVGRRPEIWNPVEGSSHSARAFRQRDGLTHVPLKLPPNGSLFVLFRDPIAGNTQGEYLANSEEENTALELSGPWQVAFDTDWGGPANAEFEELADWSKSTDDRIRYYSGTAVYTKQFEATEADTQAERVWLDLGEVKNLARVFLNGDEQGVVWTTPYRVDVTSSLKLGENQLRLEVVNLWPNRLIGDARLPRDQRFTKTNIRRFRRGDSLVASGLLGPVRLIATQQDTELALPDGSTSLTP